MKKAQSKSKKTSRLIEGTVAAQLRKSRSIDDLSKKTRIQWDVSQMLDQTDIGKKQLIESTKLVKIWSEVLRKQGITVSRDDKKYALQIFYAWLQDKHIDRPVLIAAPPGFGKTTMLNVFLKHMTSNHSDSTEFGALVVKERIADVEALQKELNSAGRNVAFAIKGYDETVLNRGEYESQFMNQIRFNVVIMTTKQYELQTMKGNVRNFIKFQKGQRSSRRRLLLIDEKPNLVINHKLTTRELNSFISDVQEVSQALTVAVPRKSYYLKIRSLVEQLREVLEAGIERVNGRIDPLNSRYKLPAELVSDFSAVYGQKKLAIMRAFERVIRQGGEFATYNGISSITTSQVIDYQFTLFNTFILDGTAQKDPDYNVCDFFILKTKKMPHYENVTFHVCDSYSLSRSSIEGSEISMDEIARMVKRIIADKEAPTLIVSYKSIMPFLEQRLANEIQEGKLITKHYDGGRGSNSYIVADNAVYIGALFKGTTYYTSHVQAVVGDRLNTVISSEYQPTKTGIEFCDPFVNDYRRLDMSVNLIQETNRLRANQKTQPVSIYLFSKDSDMVAHIADAYPGAQFHKFVPLEKLSGKRSAIDDVLEWFANMNSGDRVKGADIYSRLGIHRNTFNNLMKTEKFKEGMKQLDVIKEKTFYVKK